MERTPQLYETFERLVCELYVAEGYTKIEREARTAQKSFDFLLRSPEGEKVGVEVKLHRTSVINRGRVSEMIAQIARAKTFSHVDRAILVIGSKLGIPFADTGNVELVDLPKIIDLATRHPRLLTAFEALFRAVSPRVSPEEFLLAHIFGDAVAALPNNTIRLTPDENQKVSQEAFGEALIRAIHAVPAGKKGARRFEIKIFESLRYIFKDDMSGWSEQKITHKGLSRYDVIARISSTHDFWHSIIAFFRSWYVVFEFKNYTAPVGQSEIVSTEKYLYAGAMRMVAFVISREGASQNALEMARGSLRENGKLIVNLSTADICKMIRMKDEVNDPNAFLYDILDGMLMRLDR